MADFRLMRIFYKDRYTVVLNICGQAHISSSNRFCEKEERVIVGHLGPFVSVSRQKTFHKTPTHSTTEQSWSSTFKHIKKYDDGILGKRQRDCFGPIFEEKESSSKIKFSHFFFMYCPETLLYLKKPIEQFSRKSCHRQTDGWV